MKRFVLACVVVMGFAACDGQSGKDDGNDSISTDHVTDASYNPKGEADSAAKHMNLDSTFTERFWFGTLKVEFISGTTQSQV